VIVHFVDIGGIFYHHCSEVIVLCVDIGGIVDRHCINILFIIVMATSKYNHKKMKKNIGNHSELWFRSQTNT